MYQGGLPRCPIRVPSARPTRVLPAWSPAEVQQSLPAGLTKEIQSCLYKVHPARSTGVEGTPSHCRACQNKRFQCPGPGRLVRDLESKAFYGLRPAVVPTGETTERKCPSETPGCGLRLAFSSIGTLVLNEAQLSKVNREVEVVLNSKVRYPGFSMF